MGTLKLNDGAVEYQWTTDVSIPEGGPITVNTFGKEVPADILLLAIERREAQDFSYRPFSVIPSPLREKDTKP